MEVGNHLLHAGNSAWHAAKHVMLIPIVDPHIWVTRPYQDCINTAIALLKVVQVSVYCVLPRDWVIEVPILHHHLGLHETRLRPFQGGQIVPGAIIADTDAAFDPPVCDISKPCLMFCLATRFRATLPKSLHRQAIRYRNLLTFGSEVRVLSIRNRGASEYQKQDSQE